MVGKKLEIGFFLTNLNSRSWFILKRRKYNSTLHGSALWIYNKIKDNWVYFLNRMNRSDMSLGVGWGLLLSIVIGAWGGRRVDLWKKKNKLDLLIYREQVVWRVFFIHGCYFYIFWKGQVQYSSTKFYKYYAIQTEINAS